MRKNMSTLDRRLRTALVASVTVAIGLLIGPGSVVSIVLYALAAIMLATSAAGYCPLYSLARPSDHHAGRWRLERAVRHKGAGEMDVTTEKFQREVIGRSRELPAVADFRAGWCEPSRMHGSALEAEAAKRAGRLELVKVDVDAEPQLSIRYGIRSIPTVAVFHDGEPVPGFVGAQRARVIDEFFDEQVLGEGVDQPRADVRPAAETSRNTAVPTPARKELS